MLPGPTIRLSLGVASADECCFLGSADLSAKCYKIYEEYSGAVRASETAGLAPAKFDDSRHAGILGLIAVDLLSGIVHKRRPSSGEIAGRQPLAVLDAIGMYYPVFSAAIY